MTEDINVGSPVPDFMLPATDGRPVRLADYRGKARVVLFFVREHN